MKGEWETGRAEAALCLLVGGGGVSQFIAEEHMMQIHRPQEVGTTPGPVAQEVGDKPAPLAQNVFPHQSTTHSTSCLGLHREGAWQKHTQV